MLLQACVARECTIDRPAFKGYRFVRFVEFYDAVSLGRRSYKFERLLAIATVWIVDGKATRVGYRPHGDLVSPAV